MQQRCAQLSLNFASWSARFLSGSQLFIFALHCAWNKNQPSEFVSFKVVEYRIPHYYFLINDFQANLRQIFHFVFSYLHFFLNVVTQKLKNVPFMQHRNNNLSTYHNLVFRCGRNAVLCIGMACVGQGSGNRVGRNGCELSCKNTSNNFYILVPA